MNCSECTFYGLSVIIDIVDNRKEIQMKLSNVISGITSLATLGVMALSGYNYYLDIRNQNIKLKRREYDERALKKVTKMHNNFERKARARLLYNINQDRIKHHLKPLMVSYDAQFMADKRNKHVMFAYTHYNKRMKYDVKYNNKRGMDKWIHGVKTNVSAKDIARKYGLYGSAGNWAENAGNAPTGMSFDPDFKGARLVKTPQQYADVENSDYMQHDHKSDNGHRDNILSPEVKSIGVAVYYDKKRNYITDVEDFDYNI